VYNNSYNVAFVMYILLAESILQDCSLKKYPKRYLYCPGCCYTAVSPW